MHNLRPWISVCSLFHPRTLPSARNKVGVLYGLASSDWQTDGVCQPRVGLVPLAICERMPRRLVQPIIHGGIPAQQSCPLCYLIASVPARHWMAPLHGLWTLTEPFQSRDGQWIHRKDEDCKRTSRVVLSQYWGSVLLVAWWQYMYALPSFLSFLCLCHVVRRLLFYY